MLIVTLFLHSVLKGLSGILPIAPTVYMAAWRNRQRVAEEAAKKAQEAAAPNENVSS